jgi:hypothetical protein
VDEGDSANVQRCLARICSAGAAGLEALGNHPREDAQHHVEHCAIALHELAQALGHGQHPLAHRQARKGVIGQMRRRFHHAPRGAREAHASALAGEGHEVVVRAVTAAGARKAVGEDAAPQILAKLLAHIGLAGTVVA